MEIGDRSDTSAVVRTAELPRFAVTFDEAAAVLGVPRNAVAAAVRTRQLSTLRVGGAVVIPVAALARLCGAGPVGDPAPQSVEPEPLLLSLPEAAERLGVSEWTVREAVRKDRLPSVRIGRRILIQPSKLEALFDGD